MISTGFLGKIFGTKTNNEALDKDEVFDIEDAERAVAEEKEEEIGDVVTAAQVHRDFMNEVNNIIIRTKNMEGLDEDTVKAKEKADELENMGFGKSDNYRKLKDKKEQAENVEIRNEEKKELKKVIQYFYKKYPFYKLITKSSIDYLCNKYGLLHANANDFTGEIPEKNIEEIKNFKVDNKDKSYLLVGDRVRNEGQRFYVDHGEYNRCWNEGFRRNDYKFLGASFEIVAPKDELDMRGKRIRGNDLEEQPPPDPIVLQPVMYNNNKYYLIVTAWGDEASDPEVVNEKMN